MLSSKGIHHLVMVERISAYVMVAVDGTEVVSLLLPKVPEGFGSQ